MEDSSAVFLLDTLLSDALERQCTDIHLLCRDRDLRVLFRMRKQLVPYLQTRHDASALLRRVKALAGMDLGLHRVPEEGTFRWTSTTQSANVRVSLVPTPTGDSIVLRLLQKERFCSGLTSLGMTTDQAVRLTRVVSAGHGLMLVAGATGSGKTTTIYTLLQELALNGKSVVSIEDPVEVPQAEFVQLEVREHLGLDFATGLKALLRQDPDVIMVGEIRDRDTAQVVLQAALTGHFVVSTTHASNLPSALMRLSEFGLPLSLLADVFQAIVLQRHTSSTAVNLSSQTGRPAPGEGQPETVFEVHEMTPELRQLLASNNPWTRLRQQAGDSSVHMGDRSLWRIGG